MQAPRLIGRYAIAVVLSNQDKPRYFDAFIQTQVNNHHPLLYCNDGSDGGRGSSPLTSRRSPDRQLSFFPTLPAGEDGYIVKDVNLRATAVQTATASPERPARLVVIASITYGAGDRAAKVSRRLTEAKAIADPAARAAFLSALLNSGDAKNPSSSFGKT